MRILDRLLSQAIEADFTGHVTLEVHAHEGRLLALKSHVARSHRADE